MTADKDIAASGANSEPATARELPGDVVRSRELFGQQREILIEHEGELYRLRITRRNKLILQK